MASEEAERTAEGEEEEGNKPSKRSEKKLAQMGQRMVKEESKIRVKRVGTGSFPALKMSRGNLYLFIARTVG